MKKLVFSLLVVAMGSVSLMAQDTAKKCTKTQSSCCASKSANKTAAVVKDHPKVLSMAMSIADKDETITTRQCAESGAVSFYKQSTCAQSGSVSYQEVEFDQTSETFVNKSPKDIGTANSGEVIQVVNMVDADAADKTDVKAKACSKGAKSSCCSKGAKKPGTEQ